MTEDRHITGGALSLQPHPFTAAREAHAWREGETVAGIMAGVLPDALARAQAQVFIGGHMIPRENWARVKPRAGARVFARVIPAGGGGGGKKSPARLIVTLALSVLGGVSAGITGALGKKIFSLGLSFVGRLLFDALSPPGRSRFAGPKESSTLFIQGARNQAAPFARVPRALGRHRMVPPLGAQAWTETEGSAQYLRMLFVWGYGPLEISELKIGDTPLEEFEGVEVETRQGFPDDAPLSLYADSVAQNDLSVTLTAAGGFAVRAAESEADELSVDVTFPRGLFVLSDSGGKGSYTVTVTVGYSPEGADDWTDAAYSWTAAQGAALRESVRLSVPRGRYDVRVRRDTADAASDNIVDDTIWTAVRALKHSAPVLMPGLAMTALRIRATDQLSGVVERFNGVVGAILPDWDGAEWTPRVTANPASVFRHVLQGTPNARPLPDSRVNLPCLAQWHESCAASGREFNAVIDYDVSVRELLHDVAAAGRAAPAMADGLWSVAEDKPQSAPVQHFTPRNTWGFSGAKTFAPVPGALRVRFINRDKGWMQDEVLAFDDGQSAETAAAYDVLALPGITSAEQAWRDARYHIATARLRPETYTFHADVEHIACTRGDLVRFTHDVPLFGLASARVKAVSAAGSIATGVTLDSEIVMEAGRNYALRLRKSDGSTLVRGLVTAAGTGSAVQFAEAIALAEAPAAGDLAMFGEAGQESVELIVKMIEPEGDLSAKITCVDAAPAVHAADTGTIPPFSSGITVPPEMRRPPSPRVAGFWSAGGRAMVTLEPPSFPLPLTLAVRARLPDETAFRAMQFTVSGNEAEISGFTPGLRYDISLSYLNISGVSSAPRILANTLIQGTDGTPPDVLNLTLDIVGGTAHLRWKPVRAADIAGYRVRFNSALSGASWANSVEVMAGVAAEAGGCTLPAQAGTWLVKAVNAAGRESLSAAAVVSALDRIEGYGVMAFTDETPAFSGSMTGGSSGVAFTGDDRLVLDGGLSGTYAFASGIDLGGVYTGLLSAAIEAIGVNSDNLVDGWSAADLVEDWDGTEDPSVWGAQLQARTTSDDPGGSPAWSDWRNVTVGAVTARGFEFRLLLTSLVEGVTPSVSALRVDVSMAAWAQGEGGIVSYDDDADAGGGTRVDFPEAFYAVSAVAVTPRDLATGDYYAAAAPDPQGFNISFHDSTGARVTRSFDYIAQGTGRKATP